MTTGVKMTRQWKKALASQAAVATIMPGSDTYPRPEEEETSNTCCVDGEKRHYSQAFKWWREEEEKCLYCLPALLPINPACPF